MENLGLKLFSKLKGDKVIWACVILLSIISIVAVYSATSGLSFRFQNGNTEYYLLKHTVLIIAGFATIFFFHKINYRQLANFSVILLVVSGVLLVYTLMQGADDEINDAARWISIFGQSFQPSDLAKFSLILFIARVLTEKQDIITDFRNGFLPVIIVVLVMCGLIAPTNLSTAMLLFMTSVVLMYVAGISTRHLGSMFFIGVTCLMFLIFVIQPKRTETWKNRIKDYTSRIFDGNYEPNYQTVQSNIAIASGGFTGKGAGKSVQRNFLPHPYSDFIYAIILEEYGMLGGMFVLSLYLTIMFRAVAIVTISKTFGALLAAGLSFLIGIQAMLNMGVTVGILPVTGLSLPLISMGGTSILFTSLSIGVVLSVSRIAMDENLPVEHKMNSNLSHA